MKKQVKTASQLVTCLSGRQALTGYQDFLKPAEEFIGNLKEILPIPEEFLAGAKEFLGRREDFLRHAKEITEEAKESLGTPEEFLGGAKEIMIGRKTAVIKQKVKIKLKSK